MALNRAHPHAIPRTSDPAACAPPCPRAQDWHGSPHARMSGKMAGVGKHGNSDHDTKRFPESCYSYSGE